MLASPRQAPPSEGPPRNVHARRPLAPIPSFAALRDMVLDLDRKRKPRWRFRLDRDFIIQMQPAEGTREYLAHEHESEAVTSVRPHGFRENRPPSVVERLLFNGLALDGPIGATSFEHPAKTAPPWVRLTWAIGADPEGAWWLHAERMSFSRRRGLGDAIAVRERLLAALTPERFAVFTPDLMLKPSCLICGKGLTDPASLARWIGPECAGTSSLQVPRIYLPNIEDGEEER